MTTTDANSPSGTENVLDLAQVQNELRHLGLNLGEVLARVAHHAQRLTNAAGAVVALMEKDELVYRATTGVAAQHLGLRHKRTGSLAGLCIDTAQPLGCADIETETRIDRDICRQMGMRAWLAMPLKHAGTVVGVLQILAPEPNTFGEGEIQILQSLAKLLTTAMLPMAQYAANELFYSATHDALTGLANQALFFDRLRQRLAQAQKQNERFGVLRLAVAGLDTFAEQAGPRAAESMLWELAAYIQSVVRQGDTVARLSEYEFGFLLYYVKNPEEARLAGQRFAQVVRQPLQFEEHTLHLTASVGAAAFPEEGTDIETLLGQATQALEQAQLASKSA